MGFVTLLLQALAALPKLFTLLSEAWAAIRQMQEQHRIDAAKGANQDGDTKKLEDQLGSPRAGKPSGLPDTVVRDPRSN